MESSVVSSLPDHAFTPTLEKVALDQVSATTVSKTDFNVNDHSKSKITLEKVSTTTVSKTGFSVNDHSKSKLTFNRVSAARFTQYIFCRTSKFTSKKIKLLPYCKSSFHSRIKTHYGIMEKAISVAKYTSAASLYSIRLEEG